MKHDSRKKSYRQEVAEQRKAIEEERKRTGVSEVRGHHLPNPYRLRLLRVFGTNPPGYTAAWAVLDHVQRIFEMRWLDHWGSTVINGQRVFVSEPYLNLDHVPHIERFATEAGFEFEITKDSWWNPPRTSRITFWIKPRIPKGHPSP